MNRLSIVPAALTLVVGLAACADENTESMPLGDQTDDQAIYTDNTDSAGPTGRDDVEYIGLINMAGSRCSGILIGPRTALTATHCDPVVGEEIVYSSTNYQISEVHQPPAELATKWGPYDVSVVTLSRDVVYPGTNTKFQPYASVVSRKIKTKQTLVCNGAGPNAIVNGNPINTGDTDGASNGYHWGPFDIVGMEEGPFYRVVPGVEHGDSGGPCFWPTSNGVVLAGLNSSTVGNWGEYPQSSAIVSIADNAAAVRWIRSVTR